MMPAKSLMPERRLFTLGHLFAAFLFGGFVGNICTSKINMLLNLELGSAQVKIASNQTSIHFDLAQAAPSTSSFAPQIFNFVKELQCRSGHMDVPLLLSLSDPTGGLGKVVVDIGLDAGKEFFAALASGYSVYGFEANPVTAEKLRKRCNDIEQKCVYVNAAEITEPLPPIHNGGYLIEGGAGSVKGTMNMSLSGPGSSFVEVAPGVQKAEYKMVTILPLSHVVNTDVFFFKLDVQGFEFEVLKGAKKLFNNHNVKTMLMEIYPRGLNSAGVEFLEFLEFIWNDLGMMCSSSNALSKQSFPTDHPGSLPEFAEYLKDLANETGAKHWV